MNYVSSTIFFFQFEKPKTGGTEPGSCEEHASLVKHSDTNGTNVWLDIPLKLAANIETFPKGSQKLEGQKEQ